MAHIIVICPSMNAISSGVANATASACTPCASATRQHFHLFPSSADVQHHAAEQGDTTLGGVVAAVNLSEVLTEEMLEALLSRDGTDELPCPWFDGVFASSAAIRSVECNPRSATSGAASTLARSLLSRLG